MQENNGSLFKGCSENFQNMKKAHTVAYKGSCGFVKRFIRDFGKRIQQISYKPVHVFCTVLCLLRTCPVIIRVQLLLTIVHFSFFS